MRETVSEMPSWDDLRVFLIAARAASFSGAARTMGVKQSTVSRRVGRLEEALGVQLFERTPEGVRTTASAEALMADVEAVASHIEQIEARAAGLEQDVRGVVRVAMTETLSSLLVMPALPELLATHPELRVMLRTGVEMVDLLRREADIAIRNLRPAHPDLVSRRVATLSMGFYAHQSYLDRVGWPRDPRTLDWIAVRAPVVETTWVDEVLGVPSRLVVDGFGSQLDALRAGLGAAVIADRTADLFDDLVPLGLDLAPPEPFELFMVTHRAMRSVPRVRVVIDWLVGLAEQLSEPLT